MSLSSSIFRPAFPMVEGVSLQAAVMGVAGMGIGMSITLNNLITIKVGVVGR